MKKAETLPKHPVFQQVGTFYIFRKFWKYEMNEPYKKYTNPLLLTNK